ncbi:MAG: hypothetical protein Q7S22_07240 [Candidatus Micrarchaeota archaeon]|nr:hypothetical protein [Candidatus Micrarchaeota archaeon]
MAELKGQHGKITQLVMITPDTRFRRELPSVEERKFPRMEQSRSFTYKPAPLDFYSNGKTETPVGIGKNEDGHRVVWAIEDGFHVYFNFNGDFRPSNPSEQAAHVSAFKAKLVEEVKTNPTSEKSAFIREHAVKMEITL